MASFVSWNPPKRNEHPRLFCTRKKMVGIGEITGGPFEDGETINSSGGASGSVRGDTADGADDLVFVPASGTIGNGETLTGSLSGATATTTGSATDHTLSLETVLARTSGTHAGFWSSMKSHASSRLGNSMSYWEDQSAEQIGNFAFCYMVDNSLTSFASKAREIALHLAGLSFEYSTQARNWTRAIAMVYDWAYDYLSSAERSTLRSALASHCNNLKTRNDAEYLWGTAHGNQVTALWLVAILEDGSSSENSTWRSWMDILLDSHDDDTNGCYLAGYRYSGEADGGSYKGCGPYGYSNSQAGFYTAGFPILRTGIDVDWALTEQWWRLMPHWWIWTWRDDRTFFRNVENKGVFPYSNNVTAQIMQAAGIENNTYGEHCAWLEAEMATRDGGGLWGGLHLLDVCFRDTSRTPIRPTIARTGGNQLKVFRNIGFQVFRTGWSTDSDVAFTLDLIPFFSGGHTKRRVGNMMLNAYGKRFFYDKGAYTTDQRKPYKLSGSSVETGHRYSFARRVASAARMWRIYDSNEESENVVNSFQVWNGSSGRFGTRDGTDPVDVHNDGGQLWPHLTTPERYQPRDIGEVLTYADLRRDDIYPREPEETDDFAYVLADIKEAYYSAKVTSLKTHVLWIKAGKIPGWDQPIILLVEDFTSHVDAVGKLTKVCHINCEFAPTGDADDLTFANGSARVYYRTLNPAVEIDHDSNPVVVDGITYTTTGSKSYVDPIGARANINPTGSASQQQFVTVIMPSPVATTPPTTVLIDSGGYMGATIGGIDCKVKTASPWEALVGDSGDTTPPGAPTGLGATGGPGYVDLDWTDNPEGDLKNYDVYRSDPL